MCVAVWWSRGARYIFRYYYNTIARYWACRLSKKKNSPLLYLSLTRDKTTTKRRNQCNTILFRLSHYTFTRMIIWFDSTGACKSDYGIPFSHIFLFPFYHALSVFLVLSPALLLWLVEMCGKFWNSSLIAIICLPLIWSFFCRFLSAFYLCVYAFFLLFFLIISLLIH